MIKTFLKYMLWAGLAGLGTEIAVGIFFNGFLFLLFGFSLIGIAGVAGAIVGLVGGAIGYLLGKLARRPYEIGMFVAVISGGLAGFLALLFGCGLGC